MKLVFKIILTIIYAVVSVGVGFFSILILALSGVSLILSYLSAIFLPCLILPLIWLWKHRRKILIIWLICMLIYSLAIGIPYLIDLYDQNITINTSPNINTSEYLPFKDDSKIVKIDSEFKLSDALPIIDGAAAVFPVYSAFVNATYPKTTELYDDVFKHNNTPVVWQLTTVTAY